MEFLFLIKHMANPQKENGFTPIANEILEKIISSGLNGSELSVLFFIIRKTYGFQKKQDEISLSQFLKAIPTTKPTICKSLKTLKLVKVIKLVKKGNSRNRSNLWAFNKNYDEWQLVKKTKLVKKQKRTSKDSNTQLVKKPYHTKETIQKKDTKEIIPKGITAKAEYGNPNINKCINHLKEKLEGSLDGSIKVNRNYCQLLINRFKKDYPDKEPATQICHLIDFATLDDFHAKNLTGFKYLYNNAQKIIQSVKGKTNNTVKV